MVVVGDAFQTTKPRAIAYFWLNRKKIVPFAKVVRISKYSGGFHFINNE